MADWRPDPAQLDEVVNLIRVLGSPYHPQEAISKFESYNQWALFNLYLCFIFVYLENETQELRIMAGIILKINVQKNWDTIPDPTKHYIKENIINVISNPSPYMREICGNLITSVLVHIKPNSWPSLLQCLYQSLQSSDLLVLQGTFATLQRICEDHCNALASDEHQPLDHIVPKLIQLLTHPEDNIKWFSLRCILHLIPWGPHALLVHIDEYLRLLFTIAQDPPNAQILDTICRSFCALIMGNVSAITPFMGNIVDYMIAMTSSNDSKIALTASDFWTTIAESEICYHALVDKLPALIPVLLINLRFSGDELEQLGYLDEEQEQKTDKPEDVYPCWSKIGDIERHDSTLDPSQWTLRKSCAQALDDLSHCFTTELLDVMLPHCQQGLTSNEWLDREASILALGAVSADIIHCTPHILTELIPILLQLIDDSRPLIRSIACWSTSRYAQWISSDDVASEFLEPTILILLNHMQDPHRQVFEAAVSALSVLCDEAQELMTPFLLTILQAIIKAYQNIQGIGAVVLYDAIGSLAEAVKEELAQEPLIQIFMPPLIERWNQLEDSDFALVPLIECISRVASGLGMGFASFAVPVFERALRISHQITTYQRLAFQEPDKYQDPDLSFLVSSLELLSSIISALGSSSSDLLSNTNVLDILVQTCADSFYQVRRASFMLVGDMAKFCIVHLRPGLDAILPNLISNIRTALHVSVPNNALWATGEIALVVGNYMQPWAKEITERTSKFMQNPVLHPNIHQNAAILLGRLAMSCPNEVAQNMNEFIKPWCTVLHQLDDNQEKKSAFLGLIAAIKVNPNAVLHEFSAFAYACISWTSYQYQELQESIKLLLQDFRTQLGMEAWQHIWGTLEPDTQNILRAQYSI